MSALDSLKEFIEQRLAAAVDEIFEYFEKIVTNYEKELDRFREVLDIMLLPEIRLRREDVHSLTAGAKNLPEQQDAPQPPHIKEEQEGEQLRGRTEFPFISVTVKSEDDEEIPQPHQGQTEESADTDPPEEPADQMETATGGADCGGSDLQVKDKDELNPFNGGKTPFSCLFCGKCFCSESEVVSHERSHTRDKPYCKSLQQSSGLKSHVQGHTGEKPFKCSDCGECFSHYAPLKQHMMCHKGEGTHSGRRFAQKSRIKTCDGVNSSR